MQKTIPLAQHWSRAIQTLFWKARWVRMTPREGHVSSSWMGIQLNGFQTIADSDPELMVDGKGMRRHGVI